MSFMQIENNGPDIVDTNYWTSQQARAGYLFLSINAGAFRLLVPAMVEAKVMEMKSATEVIISRGPWPATGKHDVIELLFEDGSDTPFSVHVATEQCDRLPLDSDRHKEHMFSAWTSSGKQFECTARYRTVKRIPYLKPWRD